MTQAHLTEAPDVLAQRMEALMSEGRWQEAAQLPGSTPALLLGRGAALLGLRRDAESLECFDRVLAAAPQLGAALIGKCRALLRLGRSAEGLALLDARTADSVRGAGGIRAQLLWTLGRAHEALEAANRACALDPAEPQAALACGLLLLQQGAGAGALAAFERALASDPVLAPAHHGRCHALAMLGRTEEAIGTLAEARRLDPNNPALAVQAGHLLIQLNRFDQAVDAFSSALEQDPRNLQALRGLAQCLAALEHPAQAIEAYRQLLEVDPTADYMRGERFYVQMQCCDWRDFEQLHQDIVARARLGERVDTPGTFMAHSESPADQLICARTFAADVCRVEPASPEARGGAAPIRREPTVFGKERIRVAYLSADFSAHATAYLAAGLFEAHDRTRFETLGVSFGPDDGSAMRRRLVRSFDCFEDVCDLTDQQIATWVRERGVDIAVDLKGHTLGGRPRVFAYRPAPIQVSFLGYPGTLGSECMDYLVADRHVIPEDVRVHYVEQIIYMPGCYQVNDSARVASPTPTRREEGLPALGFVFCCFNSSYKITPSVFDDWMAILRAVPGSVLWLLQGSSEARDNLRREAQRREVDPQRLIFAPWRRVEDHLGRYALADLFLDTSPYNAHTTASDALWSGVPVLTRAGATFTSRVATSLLHALGLQKLSVRSSEEYRSTAIRIAHSPAELGSLKEQLGLARTQSTLFDSVWYCRQLERAFEAIVARYRRGEAPAPLAL